MKKAELYFSLNDPDYKSNFFDNLPKYCLDIGFEGSIDCFMTIIVSVVV